MSPSCTTLVVLLLLGDPGGGVPVACSAGPRQGGIVPGDRAVTALVCSDRPGFWVPSAYFRDLIRIEADYPLLDERARLLTARGEEYRLAARSYAATASAARDRAAIFEDAYQSAREDRDAAEARAERRLWESPTLWFGLGVVAAVGVTLALAELMPDRVLGP